MERPEGEEGPPDSALNHRVRADPDPTHVAYPRSARRRGRPVVRVAGMARSACLSPNTNTSVELGVCSLLSKPSAQRT